MARTKKNNDGYAVIKSFKLKKEKQVIKNDELNVCIGFDVSSSTVGFGVLYIKNDEIVKVDYSYYKPEDKKEDPLKSIVALYDFVEEKLNNIKKQAIDYNTNSKVNMHACVEDFLLFMEGQSSARTITVLSVYNRTVCLAINRVLGVNPLLLPVATIRSSLKKMSGQSNRVDKDHVPEVVEKIINLHRKANLPWKFRWITNRNNNPIKECYDMADGLAAGLAGSFKLNLISENS
jgi:hypothetical protein